MSANRSKVIITCAVTGSVHTPTMTPYLPITPEQIATSAIEAAQAGASILHLHARDPNTGAPSADPGLFMEFLPRIKAACDAVINITTGGAVGMTVEQRLMAPQAASPEMASLNMGTLNFGLFPIADKYPKFKFDWEEPYLRGSKNAFFRNTFQDVETILQTLGEGHGTRFEFECYDIGHLYSLAHFVEKKMVKPPFFIQSVFGILGGIGADVENLLHSKRIADQLFGQDFQWSVLAAGRHQMPLASVGAVIGGNLRVGLEDSIYLGKGELARTNAEQVAKIRRILEELGMEIASPAEARRMLALKGANQVKF